ncbi:MAG: NADH-quinone oxidoreductase subunit N [Aquihabitans sp.]
MFAEVQTLNTPEVEFSVLLPMLIMMGGALLLLVAGSFLPRRSAVPWNPLAGWIIGIVAAVHPLLAWLSDVSWHRIDAVLAVVAVLFLGLAVSCRQPTRVSWHAPAAILIASASISSSVVLWFRVRDDGPIRAVGDAVRIDGLTVFLAIVIATSVIITALLSEGYLRRERLEGSEAYVLVLLSASGGIIMASANDLMVLFLGLEILSIAVYVLAGIHIRRVRSGEAALKYFVLGAFSSGFLLYGISLVYGATGSTNITQIQSFLATNILTNDIGLLAGFAMLLVGLGFKVSAAPFHAWAPDVYDGSPSPVVAFMASAVKTAGFAGLIRVFVQGFGIYHVDWQPIVYAMALLTMIVGSVIAVSQTNVKRMLAYSSISHAGFVLMGIQAASDRGVEAAIFYLATYSLTVAGSFGVATVIGRTGDNAHDLSEYRGLSKRAPLMAFAFFVFLMAQAGVPLTAGFVAKFTVLGAAVEARSYWLALGGMLTSVISAFVYLKIVLAMYGEPSAEDATRSYDVPVGAKLAVGLALVSTLGFGIYPKPLIDASRTAVVSMVDQSEPTPGVLSVPDP